MHRITQVIASYAAFDDESRPPAINYIIYKRVKSLTTPQRMHDTGKSGWFALIPVYGFILLFFRSNQGINRYGPNPAGAPYNAENPAKTVQHCFAGITGNLSSPLAFVCTAAGIALIFIFSFGYMSMIKNGNIEAARVFTQSPIYRLCNANNITVIVSLLIGPINELLVLLAYAVMSLTGPVLLKAPQLLSIAVSVCVLYFYGTKSTDKTKNVFRTMFRLFITGILLQAGFHLLFLALDLAGIARNPYYAGSLTRFPALFMTLPGFVVGPVGMIYLLAFWAYVKYRKKWLALDGNTITRQGETETASLVQQNRLNPDDDLECPAYASVDYKPLGTKGFTGRFVVNLFFGFIAGAIYSKSEQNNTGDRPIVYKCSKCGNKWEAFPVKPGENGRLEIPCEIHFTRMGNFVGMAMAQFVYLNGRKIGPVKNGESITFTTERKQNLIFVTDHTGGAFDSCRFDVSPGGHVGIGNGEII
jgi:energy-converting hydrogenase Eha subunit E